MPAFAASLAVVALFAAQPGPALGTAVRQDGYTVRPPQAFRMTRMALFHGTRAMGMSTGPAFLSAALLEGTDEEASAMLVSVVDGAFAALPSDREAFSEAVAAHFKERLGVAFAVERAEHVAGALPRVEVTGTVRQEEQLRRLQVVAFAGEGRHAVAVFSVSAGRWDALAPAVRASLDSFRWEAPPAGDLTRAFALVTAVLTVLLLAASAWAYRRRRRALTAVEPTPG